MRVLLSAIACSPQLGSEAQFGWNSLLAVSEVADEVHLLGHDFNRQHLLAAKEHGLLPDHVTLHFAGVHPPFPKNRFAARVVAWRVYRDWSREALALAKELHAKHRFDLIHHVTVASWRVASELWRVGPPLIWGPLGGGERIPFAFYSSLSPASRMFETLRALQGQVALRAPSIRSCARKSRLLLAANRETAGVLRQLSGSAERVRFLSPASFANDRLDQLTVPIGKEPAKPLRLFAGGDLEARKGIALALQALAMFKDNVGGDFVYQVAGTGAERKYLEGLRHQYGLEQQVIFSPALRGEEYVAKLQESHVYLLPSLRDSAGLTLLEAMAAGCVPVVADCGGPGQMVHADCGFALAANSPKDLVSAMVESLLQLHGDPGLRQRLGSAAMRRVREKLSRPVFASALRAFYEEATCTR